MSRVMRKEVLMQELGVERVFIDRQSGKDTSRPELKRMMDFVREGAVAQDAKLLRRDW